MDFYEMPADSGARYQADRAMAEAKESARRINELEYRVVQLEKLMAHLMPDKRDDV